MKGTDTTKLFADRISDLIESSGKDLRTLSQEIGISRPSLSQYQNDAGECGINSLYKIANYFNVSCDYLLGLSNNLIRENVDVGNDLGLTDDSIQLLRHLNDKVDGIYPAGFTDDEFNPKKLLNLILTDEAFFLFLVEFCDGLNYRNQQSASSEEMIEIRKANKDLVKKGVEIIARKEMARYFLLGAKDYFDLIWFNITRFAEDDNRVKKGTT